MTIPVSCNFPSCMVSLIRRTVPETNWPLPAHNLSPSDLGNMREELSSSTDRDSTATAGKTDLRKAVRLVITWGGVE